MHSISIACLDRKIIYFKFKLGIWIKLNEQAILLSLNLALLTLLSSITIVQQQENMVVRDWRKAREKLSKMPKAKCADHG